MSGTKTTRLKLSPEAMKIYTERVENVNKGGLRIVFTEEMDNIIRELYPDPRFTIKDIVKIIRAESIYTGISDSPIFRRADELGLKRAGK
jgi:hypothetical protein